MSILRPNYNKLFESVLINYINGNREDMISQIERYPSTFTKWLYNNDTITLEMKLDILTSYLVKE